MKTCKRCLKEKNEDNFYHKNSNSDGLNRTCKRCISVTGADKRSKQPKPQKKANGIKLKRIKILELLKRMSLNIQEVSNSLSIGTRNTVRRYLIALNELGVVQKEGSHSPYEITNKGVIYLSQLKRELNQ